MTFIYMSALFWQFAAECDWTVDVINCFIDKFYYEKIHHEI